MIRVLLFGGLVLTVACSHGPRFLRGSEPSSAPDSLYWKAVGQLDANKESSLDSALTNLDAYLASGTEQPHRREAMVLRQLVRDSKQLARVEVALQQARSDTSHARPHSDGETKRRDDEAVKEIQRLKDELAKANEELERIRKRLATPKPPND